MYASAGDPAAVHDAQLRVFRLKCRDLLILLHIVTSWVSALL